MSFVLSPLAELRKALSKDEFTEAKLSPRQNRKMPNFEGTTRFVAPESLSDY